MKGKLSIRHFGVMCIAVLVVFISMFTLLTWRNYRVTITSVVNENNLNLEMTYLWELVQEMDSNSGELLYAQPHEFEDILADFERQYARAQEYLTQVMEQVDGQRYYNAYDISKMMDTYNQEYHRFYDTIVANQTANVFLRGMRTDLRTLNTYIKNELGDAIVDHINFSRESIERSTVAMGRVKSRLMLFALVCALSCIFMIQLLVRLLRRPIDSLIDRMDRFRSTGSVEDDEPLRSHCCEMQLLSDSFDSMAMEIVQKQENERRLARLEMNNLEMKYQLDKARLDMLQAQVNPHFLFNTLNAIYALTIQENARNSGEMISYLSSILRYSLSSLSSFVEIEHELEILSDYIHILKLRFGDTIKFNVSIEDGLEDAEIPCMVIQPLIENSIMHAFNPPGDDDRVNVIIRRDGEDICITVSDNGSGMSRELVRRIHTGEKLTATEPDAHHGIGLDNVVKRMNILYGPGHIKIDSAPGVGTRITLVISPDSQKEVQLQ